ncbi:MAG: NADH-quinone oxidoreductase subunit N [Thermoplasmata archaeon]
MVYYYSYMAPIILILFAIISMVLIPFMNKKWIMGISSTGIFISLLLSMYVIITDNRSFYTSSDFFTISYYTYLFFMLFSFIGLFSSLSLRNVKERDVAIYYILIPFSLIAMYFAISSNNLISLFVSFEAASLSTYALAGMPKEKRTLEASIKYFVIGALSSGIILLGISYYYISTDTFSIISVNGVNNFSLYILSLVLLLVGFGFKLSLFPFHNWAVDTYTGARATVSSLLSTASKIMALIIMINIFFNIQYMKTPYSSHIHFTTNGILYILFIIISILTMFYGNITALMQRDVKRMLAYSSIANAGYMAMIFSLLYYDSYKTFIPLIYLVIFIFSLAYVIMKGGSFLAMENFEAYSKSTTLDDLSGLSKKSPILAISFTVLLFSLAGIPPTLGFMGKFYLFYTLVENNFWWLALIGVINSAISVYYYFRVVMYMYWKEPRVEIKKDTILEMVVLLMAILAVIIGILTPYIYSIMG